MKNSAEESVFIKASLPNKSSSKFKMRRNAEYTEMYDQITKYLKLNPRETYTILATNHLNFNVWLHDGMKLNDFPLEQDIEFIIYTKEDMNANNFTNIPITNYSFNSSSFQSTNNNSDLLNNNNSTNNELQNASNNQLFSNPYPTSSFDPYNYDLNSSIVDNNFMFDSFNPNNDSNMMAFNLNSNDLEGVFFNIHYGNSESKTFQLKLRQTCSFDEALVIILSAIGIEKVGRFIILFEYNDGIVKFFTEDKYIESYSCYDGMNLYLFNRDAQICFSKIDHPPILCQVDLLSNVADVVKQVGEEFNIPNYMSYTLSIPNSSEMLQLNKTTIEQTRSLRQFVLVRNWFIFSILDLVDRKTCYDSFVATRNNVISQNLIINDEEAANIVMFSALIESKYNNEQLNNIKINDFLHKLPVSFTRAKEIENSVQQMIQMNETKTEFDLIKEALKYMKRLKKFSTKTYQAQISVFHSGQHHELPVQIEISPLSIKIYSNNAEILEESISYTTIIDIQNIGDNVELKFHANAKDIQYDISSTNGEEIRIEIEQNLFVLNEIISERSKYQSYLIANGIDGRNRVELHTCYESFKDELSANKYSYNLDSTGALAINVAEINLGIPHNDENVALIHISGQLYKWMPKDKIIAVHRLQNEMGLCIMKKFQEITIKLVDGAEYKIVIDITKTVEELIPEVFNQIGQPTLFGYTFWVDNFDLDIRKSIPEQVFDFSNLEFRRRYYVISYEVLKDNRQTKMTIYDCDPIIKSGKLKMNEETFIELLILSSISKGLFQNLSKLTTNDLAKITPPLFSVNENLLNKLLQKASNYHKLEQMAASKKFIKMIKQIDGFGYDDFGVKFFINLDDKSVKRNIIISIGPLYVNFYTDDQTAPFYKIHYRSIIEYQSMSKRVRIRFYNKKANKETEFEFVFKKVSKCQKVSAALYHNIFMTYMLLINKRNDENKAKQEVYQRLRGGFKDEFGVIHDSMIDLYVTNDLSKVDKLQKVWFDLWANGFQIITQVQPVLNLSSEQEYCLMLQGPNRSFKKLNLNKPLTYNFPFRGSILAVIPHYSTFTIHYYNGDQHLVQHPLVDISKTVHQLVPQLADLFNVRYPVGFTLWVEIDGKWNPLDITRSTIEQVPSIFEFIFARRFVPENSTEVDAKCKAELYFQCRDIFHRGNGWEPSKDEMAKLAYFEGKSDFGADTIIKQNINKLLPPKFQSLSLPFNINCNDPNTAKDKFIDIVRNIPGFSGGVFPIINANNAAALWFGPDFLKIISQNNTIMEQIPYTRISRFNATLTEIAIYYINSDNKQSIIHGSSNLAQRAGNLIHAHKLVHQDVYDNKRIRAIEDYTLDSVNLYCQTIKVICLYEKAFLQEKQINLSKIKTVDELKQNLTMSFNCKLDEIKFIVQNRAGNFWIEEYDLFGYPYLMDDSILLISPAYRKYYIITDDGKEEIFYFHCKSKVQDIIPYVAWKFNINFWNGYTLFDITRSGVIPLDLTGKLLDQCPFSQKFLFKRRFLMITKSDAKSEFITNELYNSVKQNILEAGLRIPEKLALEFAVYSIIESKSVNIDFNKWQESLKSHLSLEYAKNIEVREKLKSLLKYASSIDQNTARKKLCSNARSLSEFGSSIYDCIYKDQKCTIYVGPFGIEIAPKFINNSKTESTKLSYSNIIFHCDLGQKVIIDCADQNGLITRTEFTSLDSQIINQLINQFFKALYPHYHMRKNVQDMENDESIQTNISQTLMTGIILNLSEWIGDPNPQQYQFNLNWSFETTLKMSLYYLSLPRNRIYQICYMSADKSLTFLNYNCTLRSLAPNINGCLCIIPDNDLSIIFTEVGKTIEYPVSTSSSIISQIQLIANETYQGYSLGFTLYDMSYETPKPLDWLEILPTVASYWHQLLIKRRFYVFTNEMLGDVVTLKSSFFDCCQAIKSLTIEPDTIGKLATYFYYATGQTSAPKFTIKNIAAMLQIQNLPKQSDSSFESFFKQTKKLTQQDAMYLFVREASSINSIGYEKYQAKYKFNKFESNVKILLTKSGIIISDNKNELLNINFMQIDSYSFENHNTIKIGFFDNDSQIQTISIESVQYFDQISSYIVDIFDLFNFIKQTQQTIINSVGDEYNNDFPVNNQIDDIGLLDLDYIPNVDVDFGLEEGTNKYDKSLEIPEVNKLDREILLANTALSMLSSTENIPNICTVLDVLVPQIADKKRSKLIADALQKCKTIKPGKKIKNSDLDSAKLTLDKFINESKKVLSVNKEKASHVKLDPFSNHLRDLLILGTKAADKLICDIHTNAIDQLNIDPKIFTNNLLKSANNMLNMITKLNQGEKIISPLRQFNKTWNQIRAFISRATVYPNSSMNDSVSESSHLDDIFKQIQVMFSQNASIEYYIYPGSSVALGEAISTLSQALNILMKTKCSNPYEEALRNLNINELKNFIPNLDKLDLCLFQTPKNGNDRFKALQLLKHAHRNLQRISNILGGIEINKIQNAINYISAVNVCPDFISQIIDNSQEIFDLFNGLDLYSNNSEVDLAKARNSLIEYNNQLSKLNTNLHDCPSNGSVVKMIQDLIIKMKNIACSIKSNIDLTDPQKIIFGNYMKSLNLVIGDFDIADPSDDIPHYGALIQVQLDIARVINRTFRIISQNETSTDDNLNKSIRDIEQCYVDLISSRNLLNNHPFAAPIIQIQKDKLYQSLEVLNIFKQSISNKIFDSIPKIIDVAINSIDNALHSLSEAEKISYIIPPSQKTFDDLTASIDSIISDMESIGKTTEFVGKPKLLDQLKLGESTLLAAKSWISSPNTLKSQDYLNKLIDLLKRFSIIDESLADSYSYSNHPLRTKLKSEIKKIEILTKEIEPSKEMLYESYNSLNQQFQAMIKSQTKHKSSEINELLNSFPQLIANENDIKNMTDLQIAQNLSEYDFLCEQMNKTNNSNNFSFINKVAATMQCFRKMSFVPPISFDTHPYVRLGKSPNIEEDLLSLDKMIKSFSDLVQYIDSQVFNGDNKDVQDILTIINAVKSNNLVNFNDENAIKSSLINVKDCIPLLIKCSRSISNKIQNDEFTTVSRTICDNICNILDKLERPHMNSNNSRKFSQKFIPCMISIAKASTDFARSHQDSLNKSEQGSLDELIRTINNTISSFDQMLPGQRQNCCDDLYSKFSKIIPQFQFKAEYEPYLHVLANVHRFLSDYTTLPNVTIRYSDTLSTRSPSIFNQQKLHELFNLSMQIIERDNSTRTACDIIYSGLEAINEDQSLIPSYIRYGAKELIKFWKYFDPLSATAAARIFALIFPQSEEQRLKLEEYLIRIANVSIKKVMDIISILKINDEMLNMLQNCYSISSFSLVYPVMFQIMKSISTILKDKFSNNSNEEVVTTAQKLLMIFEECNFGIYEYFYWYITKFIQQFEELHQYINKNDPIISKLQEFQDSWFSILNNMKRMISFDMKTICNAANDLLRLKEDTMPEIFKSAEHIEPFQQLCKHLSAMDPVLRFLSGYDLDFNEVNAIKSIAILNHLRRNPSSSFEFAPVFALLGNIQSISKQYPNANLNKKAKICNDMIKDLHNEFINDKQTLDNLIKAILELLNDCAPLNKDIVMQHSFKDQCNDTKMLTSKINSRFQAILQTAENIANEMNQLLSQENEQNTDFSDLRVPKQFIRPVEYLPLDQIHKSLTDAGVFAQQMIFHHTIELYHVFAVQRMKQTLAQHMNIFQSLSNQINISNENINDTLDSILKQVDSENSKASQQLSPNQMQIQNLILIFISNQITASSLPKKDVENHFIKFQQSMFEKSIVILSNPQNQITSFTSIDIQKIIHKSVILSQLSVNIIALYQLLLCSTSMINERSAHNLFAIRKMIEYEINNISSHQILMNYLNEITEKDKCEQIRNLNSNIEFLVCNYDNIILDATIDASQASILNHILENSHINNVLISNGNIHLLHKIVMNNILKIGLVQRLQNIKLSQRILCNVEISDVSDVSKSLILSEIESLVTQLQFCENAEKLSRTIIQIEKYRLTNQQLILNSLISILLTTNFEMNNPKISYENLLIRYAHGILSINPEILNRIESKNDLSVYTSGTYMKISSYLFRRSNEIFFDFITLSSTLSGIKQPTRNSLTNQEIASCIDTLSLIHQKIYRSSNDFETTISKINNSERLKLVALLNNDLMQTKQIAENREELLEIISQSDILDKICLCQLLPDLGIISHPPQSFKLLKKSEQIEKERISYNIKYIQSMLSTLEMQRYGIVPDLLKNVPIKTILSFVKTIKINKLQNSLKMQILFINNPNMLKHELSQLDQYNLLLQQFLISDLINILNDIDEKALMQCIKPNSSDVHIRNKIIDSIVDLQKRNLKENPYTALQIFKHSYIKAEQNRANYQEKYIRLHLSYKFRQILTFMKMQFPSNVVENSNLITNLSILDILKLQTSVIDLLFLIPDAEFIMRHFVNVNSVDITRISIIIQDIIDRLNDDFYINDEMLVSSKFSPNLLTKDRKEIVKAIEKSANDIKNKFVNENDSNSLKNDVDKLFDKINMLMSNDHMGFTKDINDIMTTIPQVVTQISGTNQFNKIDLNEMILRSKDLAIFCTDNSKKCQYKETLIKLFESLKIIKSELNNEIQTPKALAMKLLSSLTKENYSESSKFAIEIRLLQDQSLNKIVEPSEKSIIEAYTTQEITDKSKSIIQECIQNLKKYISSDFISLFTLLKNLKTSEDSKPIINETLDPLNDNSMKLRLKIQLHDEKSAIETLTDIVYLISRTIASASAGIQLSKSNNINLYYDIAHCACNSSALLSIQLDKPPVLLSRPFLINRSLKTYPRVAQKMQEIVDLSAECVSTNIASKLELVKLLFLPFQTIITAISCRCEYKVDQLYIKAIDGQFKQFNQQIADILDKSKQFSLCQVDDLCASFKMATSFMSNTSHIPTTNNAISIFDKVSFALFEAIIAIENYSESSIQETSICIPIFFDIPEVAKPNITLDDQLKKIEKCYEDCLKDFKASINTNLVNKLCIHERKLIKLTLELALIFGDFPVTSEIQTICVDIVLNMNNLLKSFSSTNDINCIKHLTTKLFSKCKEGCAIYSNEATLRKKHSKTYSVAIKSIESAINDLNTVFDSISQLKPGQTKTWSEKLAEISNMISRSVLIQIKKLKEHPSKEVDPNQISNTCTSIVDSVKCSITAIQDLIAKKGGSEDRVITAMEQFLKLEDITKSIKGTNLSSIISSSASECKQIIQDAKFARDAKLAAKKKKDGHGKNLKSSKAGIEEDNLAPKDKIMSRLILESKVIKEHYSHEFLQKKFAELK